MFNRVKWLMRVVLASLRFRSGRSLLLLAVVSMASSLTVSLGMVTLSMERRISDEVRRYGANLLLLPDSARMDLGSGPLAFGTLKEAAWLDASSVAIALASRAGQIRDHSLHLRETVLSNGVELSVEGVRFDEIRRMLPWWEPAGRWPAVDTEVVAGADLARRLSLKPGDRIELTGGAGNTASLTVAGVVRTGGEEDGLLFLDLYRLQTLSGLEGRISMVRVLADARGGLLPATAAALESALPGARAREVRQVAQTSDKLLKKVQLLMIMVTLVVLATSCASVTGTMSTTVLERGREIGLIKAMGATRLTTVFLFAAEACVLGLGGGLAGCGLGIILAEAVSLTVFSVSTEFTPLALPAGVTVGLLIALAGSVGPMLSVYRFDPVKSLRGE